MRPKNPLEERRAFVERAVKCLARASGTLCLEPVSAERLASAVLEVALALQFLAEADRGGRAKMLLDAELAELKKERR